MNVLFALGIDADSLGHARLFTALEFGLRYKSVALPIVDMLSVSSDESCGVQQRKPHLSKSISIFEVLSEN